MKKRTLFIILLLCIVAAEVVMVFRSSGKPQAFALDSQTYDVPATETAALTDTDIIYEPETTEASEPGVSEEPDDSAEALIADETAGISTPEEEAAEPGEASPAEEESTVENSAQENAGEPEPLIKEENVTANSPEPLVKTEKEAANAPEPLVKAATADSGEGQVKAGPAEEKKSAAEDTAKAADDELLSEINDDIAAAESILKDEEKTEKETGTQSGLKENKPKTVSASDTAKNASQPQAAVPVNARIAVVIDDAGLSVPFTKQIAGLKAPLTVSFLPYGAADKKQVEFLKNAGFEVMLHVPMMPHVPASLAPVTLSPEMDKKETQGDLNAMISRFAGTGISGVNNHMGSLLTERTKNMGYVMEVLKKNGLFFLDSKTTGKSVAKQVAAEYGVPYIARDVFLDNERNYDYIKGQFRQAEKIALKKGYAVVIGHPYPQTYEALRDWLKEAPARGVEVVHISDLPMQR